MLDSSSPGYLWPCYLNDHGAQDVRPFILSSPCLGVSLPKSNPTRTKSPLIIDIDDDPSLMKSSGNLKFPKFRQVIFSAPSSQGDLSIHSSDGLDRSVIVAPYTSARLL